MVWIILSVVAVVLVATIIIALCSESGDWNDYEKAKHLFELKVTFYLDSQEGRKNYSLTEVFPTYDKMLDELEQAVFNPYFVTAEIILLEK